MRRALFWLNRVLFYLLVVFVVIYSVFPFYWAVISSFKPSSGLFSPDPSFLPIPFTLEQYRNVFVGTAFGRNLLNSLIVAGGATLLSLVLGVLAAYALGRLRFPPKNAVLYIVLSMTMFPQIAVLGGFFVLLRQVGLFNTHAGLILSYMLFTLPFTVWVLVGYFRGLPREMEEAAYVDGATPLQTLLRVMLPLTGPGLVTTGLLAFIAAWNEFLFALTFTVSDAVRTVPPAIAFFGGATPFEIPWGSIMAASVVVTVPLVILVLVFQQRIVAGLTAGAVKG
ncbi:MAG: carbohydrate ABC transporter permease [Meiothermus sp.]|uniref:carbohydrate ABC transporter permease n=1 Tax=Meiothermus sp. TaxID=1955249 RepID=UPI0025DACE4F|nr:carbohydrate ABC transporter permease [Meiothermus sp.]MCS7058649.1 carbohydrate ABC transporter permease [Meiothermus sp.]MCS7193909.1 carbohydrate ABC transporter permease [Meiothermus sp.]MCX7739875.1 carbohydrate ABC transporter permease [Meiothermus sp.]MDW8090145.1 carbohydrate ABC transporter permease [Meiothermus sp.]